MTRSTARTKIFKNTITAVAGVGVLIAGGAIAQATHDPAAQQDARVQQVAQTQQSDRAAGAAIEVEVEGLFKPNAELTVLSPCVDGDTRAVATPTFGDPVLMSPAADAPALIGTITAPNNIGPGPNDGEHLITVHCDSGANSTVTVPSAGNGDAQ